MVKVAEVGVAKHENAVSGANSVTSMYLAPEVFENRRNLQQPGRYVQFWVYALGAVALTVRLCLEPPLTAECNVLEDMVKQDLRPTHIEGTRHP